MSIKNHEYEVANVHGISGPLIGANDSRLSDPIAGVLTPWMAGWTTSTVTPPANRAYFGRFVAPRDMTIALIAFVTTVAATNDDACDVGIYSSSLARIVSAGATTGKMNATAGVQTISITATPLTKGTVYYAAFSYGAVGGTAATLWSIGPAGANNGSIIFGSTVPSLIQGKADTSHPLPNPLVSGGNISGVPVLALRES